MWRLVLILTLTVSAIFVSPVQQSEAGLAACMITARDVDIIFLGLNYVWYAPPLA